MAMRLLHGVLHATVFQASQLTHPSKGLLGALGEALERVEDVLHVGTGTQLYVQVELGEHARVARTRTIHRHPYNPVWNESFHIYCAHNVADVLFNIKDAHDIGADVIGYVKIPVSDILRGEKIDQTFPIYSPLDKKLLNKGKAHLHISLQYYDIQNNPFYGRGVINSTFPGVPYTYFKQHKGCKITLYQDSHSSNDFNPKIYLDNGKTHQVNRCWEDIYHGINNAKHLIYIAGWSVYPLITLIRDQERPIEGAMGLTLGELLKKKANEGVCVNLLVWDDRTSTKVFKTGIMGTHDEETRSYFDDSNVNCVLVGRNPDNGLSVVQEIEVSTMFTHHQKIVIVDAPLPGEIGESSNRRRIVSFVGGIDLCDGRYDNQKHTLFRTLKEGQPHHEDFHQPNFSNATIKKGGPREPWHDVHCKIEGPAAWDVLHNFEQRWEKQGTKGKLLTLREVPSVDPPSVVTYENDPTTWHVQVFRSIDAGAVAGFPEDDPELAVRSGLVSGKDSTIDRSIQDAYIHAIRRAKNFIYIENQYFLGSSATWLQDNDAELLHLIPMELALKIVDKIAAGERFSVYIVTPMWPEGEPESTSVQAILHWTRRTMEMMYHIVCNALQSHGLSDKYSPLDYLSFFCLGNRERRIGDEYIPPESPPENSNYIKAQDQRRFMIYVHAKTMIVDDEYIIVGSANINERSMNGGRDSEIAMGAFQPYHTAYSKSPRGEVHGFRMSLWYEHLGRLENCFLEPSNVECIHRVNAIANELWSNYVKEDGDVKDDLPGHLLPFPISVSNDGIVKELNGQPHFPDTNAPILGTKSKVFPSILTG